MQTPLRCVLILLGLMICAPAYAVSVEDVPNPRESNAWVSDPNDIIPVNYEDGMNRTLDLLERDTDVEVAVVAVDQVDTATPKDFATELFNYWGIGKADTNNGLLILLVRGERRLEMETGYGTESVLTDGWLKRMQGAKMVPEFKRGRYGAGLSAGVDAVDQRLRKYPDGIPEGSSAAGGSQNTYPARQSGRRGRGGGLPWPLFVFVGFGVVFVGGYKIWKYRKDRTCPHCDMPMTMLSEQADDAHLDEGQQLEEVLGSVDYQFYYCVKCDFDRLLRNSKWFSGYSKCPRCRYKTLSTESEVTRQATTMHSGRKRITVDCMNCDYHSVHHVTIPRRTSSSSSSGGGGGFSGGGGGSSFGGGSSGGGGAGSSW